VGEPGAPAEAAKPREDHARGGVAGGGAGGGGLSANGETTKARARRRGGR